MRIEVERTQFHKYALKFDFSLELLEYCRGLKDEFGWESFSFSQGKWRFKDPAFLLKIKQRYPDVEMDEEASVDSGMIYNLLIGEAEKVRQVEQLNSLMKTDFKAEGVKTKLRPYQQVGVLFFLQNNGRGYLADDMGSGKTLQTLAYITHTKKQRVLVICPASVKWSWYEEVKKHTHLKAKVIDSKSTAKDFPENKEIIIINYDILGKFLKVLTNIKWDCIVCDEAHMLKSVTALRTKRTKALTRGVQSVIFLSGTPILSRPVEIFTSLNMIDPYTWDNWWEFVRRYCDARQTRWGLDTRGASNIPELQGRISKYFLRRTKDVILPDLPPKNFIKYPVELDDLNQTKYDEAMERFVEYLRNRKKKKAKEIENIMKAEKLVKLGELRMITTQGKIKACEDLIESLLEASDEKILLFGNYIEPLKKIHERFKDCSVLLTGQSTDDERRWAKDKFQTSKKTKLFIGGIKSAGVGITLTQASNVIFLDYAWNPGDHSQAIDRAHRIGSVATQINIYQLYTKGTIDEYMTKTLESKQEIFNQLINGQVVTKKGRFVKELIKSIEAKYEIN